MSTTEQSEKKQTVRKLVIVTNNQGYWGSGETIEEASVKARGLGACLSVVFYCFLLSDDAEVWIGDDGSLTWRGDMQYQRVFLKNGKVKLNDGLLKKAKQAEKDRIKALRKAKK